MARADGEQIRVTQHKIEAGAAKVVSVNAEVFSQCENTDVAILKVGKGVFGPGAKFYRDCCQPDPTTGEKGDPPGVDTPIVHCGSPRGLHHTVSRGYIVGLNRDARDHLENGPEKARPGRHHRLLWIQRRRRVPDRWALHRHGLCRLPAAHHLLCTDPPDKTGLAAFEASRDADRQLPAPPANGSKVRIMKAISIMQPWALLLVCGVKQYETRTWRTSHRGLLYIHASQRLTEEMRQLCGEEPLRSLLKKQGVSRATELRLGALIGTVEVIDCIDADARRDAESLRIGRATCAPLGLEDDNLVVAGPLGQERRRSRSTAPRRAHSLSRAIAACLNIGPF